jgi:hypothetical protein
MYYGTTMVGKGRKVGQGQIVWDKKALPQEKNTHELVIKEMQRWITKLTRLLK